MKTLPDKEELIFNPPELGCILYLPGLPGSGSRIYDRSPYGNDGTITGATWVRTSGGLWCLSFDGSDDVVHCGNDPSLNILTTLSVKIWLKFSQAANRIILEKSNNNSHYHFQVFGASNDQVLFGISNSDASGRVYSTNALNDDRWHQCIGTFDSSANKLQLFVDGALDNTNASATHEIVSNSQFLFIGNRSGSYVFPGLIGLVAIYNRVLNPVEIQSGFHQEKHLFGVW